jgi:hypothetical protein
MENKKIYLINTAIDFIETKKLGLTDPFNAKEENYSDIEKNRLDYLLEICDNLIEKKIHINDIQELIKNKLQISENISAEITEKIKAILSEEDYFEKEIEEKKEAQDIIAANKKSIFSTIINKK